SVGTGFSDKERHSPPPLGSTITFRYQELSEAGVPRFPSYVGVRAEAAETQTVRRGSPTSPTPPHTPSKRLHQEEPAMSESTAKPRRFEFSEGKSNKFWEISQSGTDVTVHFGRIGTSGQTKTKSFADEAAAKEHMDKLIAEKTEKG